MKCRHCGCEWNPSQAFEQLKNCPFCGGILAEERKMDTVDAVLAEINDQFGLEALADGQRLIGLFVDLAPGMSRERRMLEYLVACDGHTVLLEVRDADAEKQSAAMKRVAKSLYEDMLMAETFSRQIRHAFWKAMGADPVKAEPEIAPLRPVAEVAQKYVQVPVADLKKEEPAEKAPVDFVIEDGVLREYNGSCVKVDVPPGVCRIGDNAFQGNQMVCRVGLPTGVESIGMNAFAGCENLTYINLPVGLKRIQKKAFYGCKQIKYLDIPESTESIDESAFERCEHLQRILIPGKVWNVAKRAFYGCTELGRATVNHGVRMIGAEAFAGCTELSMVRIPDSVQSVGDDIFTGCRELVNINASELWKTRFAHKIGTGLVDNRQPVVQQSVSPSKIDPDFVIENNVLVSYKGLSLIVQIPDGVKEIGNDAFSMNRNIETVNIPSSVERIGDRAFGFCTNLKQINWGVGGMSRVQRIGANAFTNCKMLQSVQIPQSVKSIGVGAFQRCIGLHTITFSNGLQSIGSGAFEGCGSLTSVTIPGSVSTIFERAFKGCTQLKNVVLRDGVRKINSEAFSNCAQLRMLEVPDSVVSVGNAAFAHCSSLRDINASASRRRMVRQYLSVY